MCLHIKASGVDLATCQLIYNLTHEALKAQTIEPDPIVTRTLFSPWELYCLGGLLLVFAVTLYIPIMFTWSPFQLKIPLMWLDLE